MDLAGQTAAWTPVSRLRARFDANLEVLGMRDAALANRLANHCPQRDYAISAAGDQISLATVHAGAAHTLGNPVSPQAARQIVAKLAQTPTGPIVVAGLDQGWLWDALSKLSIEVAAAPGHRPPLYLLSREIERLWLVLHLHDWRQMLADRRCIIFAGDDAAAQLQAHLIANPHVPWPQVAVTVDPAIWPAGASLDSINAAVAADAAVRCDELTRKIDALYAGKTAAHFAEKLRSSPLRILGITSLYTTFLQHSMRDWLCAMQALGHETRLLIEQADHERPHPLIYLGAIADFRPDLILLIDHYRGEFPFMPKMIPAVMWVQDRLPNIFCPATAEAQGAMDFVIGYGRRDCVTDFGYPRTRFMEAPVGVNEQRFDLQPQNHVTELSEDASIAKNHANRNDRPPPCPSPRVLGGGTRLISFVSHASAPPERLIEEQIARQPAETRPLLSALYDSLAAIYARGEFVTQECFLQRIVEQSIAATRTSLQSAQPLLDFVTQKLNNAFFRHQALHWLADGGFELALYGNGWENHPKFARFARGPADNQTQLAGIYRSSAINLQATPFGSAHQRLFEGLCAGGFFLLRKVTGDDVEPVYVELWDFCRRNAIRDNDDLRRRADARTTALLHHIEGLTGEHPLTQKHDFIDALRATAQTGFIRTSSTLWPDYARVAFSTRDELLHKTSHYLENPSERCAVAQAMRQRVLETVTYRRISGRMLAFIADDLALRSAALEAAA